MSAAGIGIICKAPRAGESKTRLEPILGSEAAARIAGCFIRDVAEAIGLVPAAVGWRGYGVAAQADGEAVRALLPPGFDLVDGSDGDVGAVLSRAAEVLLAGGHDSVLLVSQDCPTLPPLLVAAALAALRGPGDRLVLGPTVEGGYSLIGLKQAHHDLFRSVVPDAGPVVRQIEEQAAASGLAVTLLPQWYDVDEPRGFALLLGELTGELAPFMTTGLVGSPATATRGFASEHSRWPGSGKVAPPARRTPTDA